jgi:hypothetical protein
MLSNAWLQMKRFILKRGDLFNLVKRLVKRPLFITTAFEENAKQLATTFNQRSAQAFPELAFPDVIVLPEPSGRIPLVFLSANVAIVFAMALESLNT